MTESSTTSAAPQLNTATGSAQKPSNSSSFLSEDEQRQYALLTNDVSTEHIDIHSVSDDQNEAITYLVGNEQTTGASAEAEQTELADYLKNSYKLIRVLCVWC